MEEVISVKGNKGLGNSLRNYLNFKQFADVCFIIENQQIFAHKIILSSRSPYFSNLILANCKDNSTLEIEIEDSAPKIFLGILEYMYTDEIRLSLQTVWETYKAAKFYELFDLVLCCQDFINQKISVDTVADILKNSQIIENQNIANSCYEYIEKNIKTIDLKKIGDLNEVEKKIIEYKNQHKNTKTNYFENTLSEQTQTIQPWNSTGLPPTAFPAPESISAFPSFFKQKNDQQNPLEVKKSSLHRRLSIVSDPSAAGKKKKSTNHITGVFLQILVSCTTKLLSCERTSLFMFDKVSDELVSQVANGDRKYSNDIALKDERSRNVICSPILDKENKIIGVIEILHSSTKEFTIENETHLRTISALFSIVFEEREKEGKEYEEEELPGRSGSGGSTSSLKAQRKRSLFDLNFLSEEDFNISEILESRNSSDFKLPNEENMDTSFQNLLRSYSIERRNSELHNYQFGEPSDSQSQQQPQQQLTSGNSSGVGSVGVGGGGVGVIGAIQQQKKNFTQKRQFVEQPDYLQPVTKNDPFQMDQQQYTDQIQNSIQPNIPSQTSQQSMIPQMIQQPMTQQQQAQLTFISEEFHSNDQNPKKKKKIENLPFMHFRIPRYELQFIQFEGNDNPAGKKKKK